VGRYSEPFGSGADAAQHALRHDEARDRNRFDDEPRGLRRIAVSLAHDGTTHYFGKQYLYAYRTLP
jgi:hypothetical protein